MASEPGTRIQLCGRFVARIGGRRMEHELPSRQGRLLFAYLVTRRERPVSRDELADALWADAPPSAPQLALSALLSKLRRVVGPAQVEGRDAIRLVLPPGAEVDAEQAVEAAHMAETSVAAGDWDRAYGRSHVALYIARRGFLPGYEAPWIDDARRGLEEVQARALECAAATALGLRGCELAIGKRLAQELVALSPYRESGYRLLMELLEAEGNVAEALLVHERLRGLLRDELGAAPGPAVQAVHGRLLRASDPAAATA